MEEEPKIENKDDGYFKCPACGEKTYDDSYGYSPSVPECHGCNHLCYWDNPIKEKISAFMRCAPKGTECIIKIVKIDDYKIEWIEIKPPTTIEGKVLTTDNIRLELRKYQEIMRKYKQDNAISNIKYKILCLENEIRIITNSKGYDTHLDL